MPARNQPEVMSAPGPCDGRLSPWADAVTDAPGWQITTRSRRLAGAVAATIPGATVHPHEKGEWQARIPQAVLMVVVIDAGAGALRCHPAHTRIRASSPWPLRHGGRYRAEMPTGSIADTRTAIGARRAGHHPHGPHGALSDTGIHHAVNPSAERRRFRHVPVP